MWIDYSTAITESAAELAACEHAARGRRWADRVKLLRLLKSGRERSLRRAAAVLGYTERQVQRWWHAYRADGLAGLLAVRRPGGRRERITPAALAGLEGEMRAGRIARLREAQAYLRERWGIRYSLDGLSGLFQRHKIKRKTGRPRHRRADAAAQAAFKKSVRGHA
ncbi:MAG TPA: winged helix-turn-helix domain-containing protein [Stellaceae bacterium]|jgi:transposase|nr:winged helix-turn-helix domain-containing protein [Stellaceae bacterium]